MQSNRSATNATPVFGLHVIDQMEANKNLAISTDDKNKTISPFRLLLFDDTKKKTLLAAQLRASNGDVHPPKFPFIATFN